MPDLREWIASMKEVEPPEFWHEAVDRAGRLPVRRAVGVGRRRWGSGSTSPRWAALFTGAAIGVLALAVVVVGIGGRPIGPGEDNTPSPGEIELMATHQLLERLLSDLWIAEARRGELQGEIGAAQDEYESLIDLAGDHPTDSQRLEIERWEQRIRAWTRSMEALTAEISQLRAQVEEVRDRRAQFLPPEDAALYPDVATVTCDGDGEGGTHLSTPVVRSQSDGVHLRVVNRLSNEPVFLVAEPDPRRTIRPGATEDVVLEAGPQQDIEIVCTYEHTPSWERPSHPLWIAPASPGGATTSPTPPVSILDPLTLTASLDEPGVTWTEVAFVPIGDAEGELGRSACSDCVLPVPAALAVDRAGTYWIADPLKHRVAHFDADGSFIEAFAAPGGPVDLAFVGDRLYALLAEGGSRITSLGAGGFAEPITVNNEGRGFHVQALIGGQEKLLVLVSGAERLLGGYWAFATVDPVTGQITPASGLRSPGGARVDFQPLLDSPPGDYQIRWYPAETGLVTAQEVRFQLVRDGRELRTTAGDTYLRASTRQGVATIVGISDLSNTVGGLWYLEITPEGGPPIFERLADAGLVGTANNRRYLTVGPDGDIYVMRLFDNGVRIYRR